jgi:hypothetical protein
MASAIIGGLVVAAFLARVFLAALYVARFCIKEPRKEPEPSVAACVRVAAR